MVAKAFSYLRCSTPEQLKGDTVRRQLDGAHKFCDDRGLELDDTLRDLGRSAYKGKHAQFGALRKFLDLVEDGTIPRGSYLIVESFDRLSRETVLDAAARLFDLIRAGIIVVTLSDGQEYSDERLRTDWTPLIVSIAVMARAHDESRVKSQRVGKAWAQKRIAAQENGQAMTAITPAWIRLVGGPRTGRYELIPERAKIVKGIVKDTIDGLGRRTIAKALNEAGEEPWGVGGKKGLRWHNSYIQKILGNPALIGRFEPLGKLAGGDGSGNHVLEGYYPAVVSEAEFYAAQAAAGSRRMGQGRPSEGHRNLLRGLAKCSACGSNLIFVDKGKRSAGPKLICGSAHASAGCQHRTYYGYDRLETYVLGAVSDRLGELLVTARDRTAAVRAEHFALVAQREDKERRHSNLLELVEAGGGGSVVAGQMAKLQADIDQLDERIAAMEFEIKGSEVIAGADMIEQFHVLVHQLKDGEDEDLPRARASVAQRLRSMVERIVVEPEHATVELIGGGEAHVHGRLH